MQTPIRCAGPRSDPSRPRAGRVDAEQDADANGDAECHEHRLRRDNRLLIRDEVNDYPRNPYAQKHACQATDPGEEHALDEKMLDDVAALAPSARRIPISRVRSVTVASMMFMMPMPPTKSEIEAIVPKMMLN